MNIEGLAEKLSSRHVKYYENISGQLIAKTCTKCCEIKATDSFGKEKKGLGGRKSICKGCEAENKSKWHEQNRDKNVERSRKWREDKPEYHRKYRQDNKERKSETDKTWRENNSDKVMIHDQCRRARKKALPNDFTNKQMSTIYRFFSGCALTGTTEDIHWDHVIPLVTGHGGTVFGNMIPLRGGLNMSKQDMNIFEWFNNNKDNYNVSQERFDRLIEWLGKANWMTVEEYRDYVYWCHANPRNADELMAK